MLVRRVHWAATAAGGFLGLAHLGLTPVLYPGLAEEGLWFGGSGLAVLLAALINLQLLLQRGRPERTTTVTANLATAAFFGVLSALLKEPQMIVGLLVFVVLAGTSWRLGPREA